MFNAKIIPPTKAIEAINAEYRKQPGLMATAMKRSTASLKKRWLKKLRVEPAPPKPGFGKLMTPKQRRKVHAMRRERGGGAYDRTHKLTKAWEVNVESTEKGGAITIENDNPVAEFVYGVRRQRFIEAIGWLDVTPLLPEFEKEAETVLDETFFTVSDPFAGVRP